MSHFYDAVYDAADPSRTVLPAIVVDGTVEEEHDSNEIADNLYYADGNGLHSAESLPSRNPSKRARVRHFARKTKEKSKGLLHLDSHPNGDMDGASDTDSIEDISTLPAFNPSQVLDKSPPRLRGKDESNMKSKIRAAASAIAHPQRTIRDKATQSAADKLSKSQRPFLAPENDKALLQAHESLTDVISSRSSMQTTTEEDGHSDAEKKVRNKIDKLEEQRVGLQIAWTVGRHIERVRVVQRNTPHLAPRSAFVEYDGEGHYVRFKWERWLAYLALYYTRGFTAQYIDDFDEIPFSIQDLSRTVERLLLVSHPWQDWLVSVREVYTWDDPRRTAKWMCLFWLVWYFDFIVGFFYGYVIFMVMKNKFYPTSVESIRKSLHRGVDEEARAHAWGELVEKHGRQDWVEPLLDVMGPLIQLQLGDLANLVEVITSFYRWQTPNKTAATLFFFCCCLSITIFADMRFCMRLVWFIIGGGFFFCWPIATRYPKYRYLVDPLKWIFWDIPTNAEWSIQQLQEKALLRQKAFDDKLDQTTTSEVAGTGGIAVAHPRQIRQDHGEQFSFRAHQGTDVGRLVIDRLGIYYERVSNPWNLPFNCFVEVRKIGATATAKVTSLGTARQGIEFIYMGRDGLEHSKSLSFSKEKRDQVFSIVLGWSGQQWRVLQMPRGKKAEGESHLDSLL